MYVDFHGSQLRTPALEFKKGRDGRYGIAIWWNKVPSKVCAAWQINDALDELDEGLEFQETKQGCKTISRVSLLYNKYFIRYKAEDDIEVCGCRTQREDVLVFRYVLTKAANGDEDNAYEAWLTFKAKTQELTGLSLAAIFGGLPREFHQYRNCVPSPINWVNESYINRAIGGCTKADICSAYGSEASKTLPDLHADARCVVNGKIEPTEEWPFAFYLESGEMAIWGEGSSAEIKQTKYMRQPVVEPFCEERTLLCKAAKTSLRPVFEYLYTHRSENESFKFVMNATIGMFHRKRYTGDNDNLWPLAAVIKFRCDKRIVDLCNELYELGQIPLLINTDSITWRGKDISLTVLEKKLGNFRLEYENCGLVYVGPKCYQVKGVPVGGEEEEILTRWSGPHRTSYITSLPFGAILDKTVLGKIREEEKKNIYRWDRTKRRFVTKAGTIFKNMEEN